MEMDNFFEKKRHARGACGNYWGSECHVWKRACRGGSGSTRVLSDSEKRGAAAY